MTDDSGPGRRVLSRRGLLASGAAVGVGSLAGCGMLGGDGGGTVEVPSISSFRGSGPLVQGRPEPGGTSIRDLPNLSGDLALYIGGGEGGIYYQFVEKLQQIYPDFTVYPNDAPSSSLARQIVKEANSGATRADVFWSIDASSLGYVVDNDAYASLSTETVDPVPSSFRGADRAWVGVAGRARSVPYNTNRLSADDIPNKVADFPQTDALRGSMEWAPTYGAFKSFVTAMRLLRGREATKKWLVDMREAGTERAPNEYVVSQDAADGITSAGFANHYYAMRVKNGRPNAPLDLAFTEGDAGALVNVAGVLKTKGTQKDDLVANFVRHLLSAEAQEYFATISFAYPMISGVQPVGGLPTIDELNPPDIDLSELSNLEATLELMREADVLG